MGNPYDDLPTEAFWRPAVAARHPSAIAGLWKPKRAVGPAHKIATAGSCFAQHIGRALVQRQYQWIDGEPAPPGMITEDAKRFNYGVFSFRTGNIYTASLLKQWVAWALSGRRRPPDEIWQDFWLSGDRWFDPFRPAIEPNGFASREEALASRMATLRAIRKTILTANYFVFTMGLTESWRDAKSGLVFPMCPGTIAGTFDETRHTFVNERYETILADMNAAFSMMRTANPDIRFIVTVSPVPLTASASGEHVLTATTHSKSILRAVAGALKEDRDDTDYFPSYEIITGAPFRSMFFEPNLRSVAPDGVAFVMRHFFSAMGDRPVEAPQPERVRAAEEEDDDLICEEIVLQNGR
jgi:hypothetical protein